MLTLIFNDLIYPFFKEKNFFWIFSPLYLAIKISPKYLYDTVQTYK